MTMLLFALSGAAGGTLHAALLAWRGPGRAHPAWPLLRLSVPGAVLVAAAVGGGLLAAAAGWLPAFALGVARAYRGIR